MHRRLPVAREGYPFVLVPLGLAIVSWSVIPWLGWVFFLLAGFSAYFFRDPERTAPPGGDALVSPADGRVMQVKQVREERFLKSPATVVSIFLSLADVHVNRAPMAGTVAYQEYVPGRYVVAFADKASEINERNYVGIDSGQHRVLVCQIAGLVARRIVCHSRPGDWLEKGERFGLIRFGSSTQVFMPPGMVATVKPGDRVVGGVTVIGRVTG